MEKDDIHNPRPCTWTGTNNIDLLDPQLHTIHAKDIFRSLSREPRYSGMSDLAWTVGAHSLLCCVLAEDDGVEDNGFLRALLMHDASEAYIKDINRPFKMTDEMAGYRKVEKLFEERIAERFGLRHDERTKALIKHYDNLSLACEVHVIMPAVVDLWGRLPSPTASGLDTVSQMTRHRKFYDDVRIEDVLHRFAGRYGLLAMAGSDLT